MSLPIDIVAVLAFLLGGLFVIWALMFRRARKAQHRTGQCKFSGPGYEVSITDAIAPVPELSTTQTVEGSRPGILAQERNRRKLI